MNEHQAVIVCSGLHKQFAEVEGNALHVLDDINLSVERAQMVAIVGASGSGKSTLLHVLGGLDCASSGQVVVAGQNILTMNESEKARLRNHYLGFIYQFHHLLPEFNALENVCMPLRIRGVRSKEAVAKALEMIEEVGLSDRIKHRVSELSGGERQRIAIARALVNEPACVLADEPTGNLDEDSAKQVFELMLRLNRRLKTSFVVVTHNLVLAKQMDRQFVLKKGKLVTLLGEQRE